MNLRSAIHAVDEAGALLVFPIKDTKEPMSLWSVFFPRSKMRWEWDEGADQRVSDLWFLREKLSSSGKVVYTKWFRGRATLFSREVLPALLCLLNPGIGHERFSLNLSREAKEVLDCLKDNSPLSTKQLKEITGLQGKLNESDYSKRLKELWQRLLIVGVGEVDDGAFPSLAIGATQLYFENEWAEAADLSSKEALEIVASKFGKNSLFFRYLAKNISKNISL